MDERAFQWVVKRLAASRGVITAVTIACTLAGLWLSSSFAGLYESAAILQPARISTLGPIERPAALEARLEARFEEMKGEGEVREDTSLELRWLRTHPPRRQETGMLEIVATSPGLEDAKIVTGDLLRYLIELEAPRFLEEQTLTKSHIQQLSQDLTALRQQTESPAARLTELRIIERIAELEIDLSETKSNPTRVIRPPVTTRLSSRRPRLLFGLLGMALGFVVGGCLALISEYARDRAVVL